MRFSTFALAAAIAASPLAVAEAQNFTNAATPTTVTGQFWDVPSADDGRGCNIGYVLAGTYSSNGCFNNQILGTYSAPYSSGISGAWFAHSTSNWGASVGFAFYTSDNAQFTYFGGIAGATPLKELAVRDLGTNTIVHTFNAANASYTFSGPGYFDIGIATFKPTSATPNFFSWTAVTPNQFTVFGDGATYGTYADCGTACWVGAEDVGNGTGDYDYNDGLLRITDAIVYVPEPSNVALFAIGGLVMIGAARRRRA